MTDTSELVRLAREATYMTREEHGAITMLVGADFQKWLDLRDAVLALHDKKEEPRKVAGWYVKDGATGNLVKTCEMRTEEDARKVALHYATRCGSGSFACYVTGIEGIGPDDSPPVKSKGREWWLVSLGVRNHPQAFHTEAEAHAFADLHWQAAKPIRVREIEETE